MRIESDFQNQNKLLDMGGAYAASRWDQLLEAQTDVFLPHEIEFFLANEAWAEACSVLDVGCGNGYYLSRLKTFFPQKRYTGIDISPRLIEIASSNGASDGVHYQTADFFEYEPHEQHDIVLMRLIVQHMKGIGDILQHAAGLIKDDGRVVVIEPDPEHFANHPQTPMFDELLRRVADHASNNARNKGNLSRLGSGLDAVPGWRLSGHVRKTVPHTGPFANTRLLQMLQLWIDILEGAGEIDFAFDDARHEIKAWSQNKTAYNQIGIQIMVLERAP